jgi:hypothetical protein
MKTLSIDDEEWQLIVELLESERSELPGEIHHTDTSEYKGRLSKRLDVVNKLLATLRKQ